MEKVMPSILESYKEDFYLLLEAGFIAINMQDEDSANKLFQACQILNPKNTFPLVGLGYKHLCKLELAKAQSCFKEVLKLEPENQLAKSLLAVCMTMNPKEHIEGEKKLEELSKSQDADIKKLADIAMDFSHKISPKNKSPAHPKQAKHK
jgi:hypothetical protein